MDLTALADVHRITTETRGRPLEIFVFDHHRTAFTVWGAAAADAGPLGLVTLDRHMDLNSPRTPPPAFDAGLETLDRYARHALARANDDHIVAAMEAGAIGDALVVARSHAPTNLEALRRWTDAAGRTHELDVAPTLALALARGARPPDGSLVLDVDLDCFTTLSDGHPDEVLTWDRERIALFLRPPGSDGFWDDVLARTRVVTIAREPFHCGGFELGARLWIDFARVFFNEILEVPVP